MLREWGSQRGRGSAAAEKHRGGRGGARKVYGRWRRGEVDVVRERGEEEGRGDGRWVEMQGGGR